MPFVSAIPVSSPTNIAVIKYWGKREQKLNLPINSSVSVTIDQADLCTTTTVTASGSYPRDRLWLNGEEEDAEGNKRVQRVLKEVRDRAGDLKDAAGNIVVRKEEWANMRVHVVSKNNFPTAAGLASSAAGYAALAFALAKLHGVVEKYPGEMSTLARIGSGSACRSLHGGFVAWDMGSKPDGSDSKARMVGPASHWPQLKVLILVVSDSKKAVSSTAGMQNSVETSPLLAHRAAKVVPGRMIEMEKAYLAKVVQRSRPSLATHLLLVDPPSLTPHTPHTPSASSLPHMKTHLSSVHTHTPNSFALTRHAACAIFSFSPSPSLPSPSLVSAHSLPSPLPSPPPPTPLPPPPPPQDFPAFAKLAMQDSNQFHATCLDTQPPIFYLNDVSRAVIQLCHAINDACGETRVGYTFDAGPNAVLFATEEHMPQVLASVLHAFPPPLLQVTFPPRVELSRQARTVHA